MHVLSIIILIITEILNFGNPKINVDARTQLDSLNSADDTSGKLSSKYTFVLLHNGQLKLTCVTHHIETYQLSSATSFLFSQFMILIVNKYFFKNIPAILHKNNNRICSRLHSGMDVFYKCEQ